MSPFFARIVHTGLGLAGAGSAAAGELTAESLFENRYDALPGFFSLFFKLNPKLVINTKSVLAFCSPSSWTASFFGIGQNQHLAGPSWYGHYILHDLNRDAIGVNFSSLLKSPFKLLLIIFVPSSDTEKPGDAVQASSGLCHGTTLGAMP